jgi:ribosome biogenesis protein BRX1
VRNYQVVEQKAETALEAHIEKKETGSKISTSLVEIGPRFVLDPIRIFRGPFGGQTLYQNPNYVSPNIERANMKRMKGKVYDDRKEAQQRRKDHKEGIELPEDPLDSIFRE